MRKALSPLVSVVILVVVSISIASFVAPWMYELVTTTTNQTGRDTETEVKCRFAGLDLDSNYGTYGIDYNFTGNTSDWLKAKILNTGNLNLYGFSFEVTLDTSGETLVHYDSETSTVYTEEDPLRAGRSAIIKANISTDINESITTLKAVKVLNVVCPSLAPSIEL